MKDMHWYLTNNALVPPIYNLYFYLFIYFLVDVLKFLSQSPHKLISNAHTHSPHHPYLTLPKCPTKTSAFANPRTPLSFVFNLDTLLSQGSIDAISHQSSSILFHKFSFQDQTLSCTNVFEGPSLSVSFKLRSYQSTLMHAI